MILYEFAVRLASCDGATTLEHAAEGKPRRNEDRSPTRRNVQREYSLCRDADGLLPSESEREANEKQDDCERKPLRKYVVHPI
jgi:hypothetical protein